MDSVWNGVFSKFFHSRKFTILVFCSYSENTSVTNLDQHLSSKHKIELATKSTKNKQKNILDSFFQPQKKHKTAEAKADSQFLFNRNVVLSFCRDLERFSKIERPGFRDFWEKYNSKYELPSRTTLERAGLDDAYQCCKLKMIDLLKKACDHGSMTFDCWSDNVRQRAFIGYTYHFLSENWSIKTAVLKVSTFPRPHTAERIRDNFIETLNEFEIAEKKISVVTDGGANVVKCTDLLKLERSNCISHAAHLLIAKDLFKHDSMGEIRDLFAKLCTIQRKMLYKYDQLKELDSVQKNEKLFDALELFANMGGFQSKILLNKIFK